MPRYLPKRNENLNPYEDFYMNVHRHFVIVPNWDQPKCLSQNQWIKKLWYIIQWNSINKLKKKNY